MPLDPSIPLQVKPIEIQNPVDMAVKAMTLKNLAAESQSHELDLARQQIEMQNQSEILASARNSQIKDPNTGLPTLDRAKFLGGISNPLARNQAALNLNEQEQKQMKWQHDTSYELARTIVDQKTQEEVIAKADQLGLPPSALKDHLSKEFTPDNIKSILYKKLSWDDQLKSRKADIQEKKLDLELAKMGQAERHFVTGQQSSANQAYATGKEGVRQRPDVKIALTDELQYKKAHEAVAEYLTGVDMSNPQAVAKALDKVPLPRQRLFFTELSKMSKGGVAGEGETEENIPNGSWQRYAAAMQSAKGKPQAANAGEFIRQGLDYATGLHKIAFDSVSKANEENLAQHANHMSPADIEVAKKYDTQRMIDEEISKRSESQAKNSQISHGAAMAQAKKILDNPNSSKEDRALAQRALDVSKKNSVGKR